MMKLGNLSVRENATVYADLEGDTIMLYVPEKKSKAIFWKDQLLYLTKESGKSIEAWGDNPGIVIAVHQKLKAFLEDKTKSTMLLPVNGKRITITQSEAVILEHDIHAISEELKRRHTERVIRGIRTVRFAEGF